VYTGKESRVMLNLQKPRQKISNIEIKLNQFIVILFFIQILVCLLLCIITAIYDAINDDNQTYLGNDNSDENVVLNFFTYFLLMSTLIPISLIITLEIVKVVQ
jgi:magnesium-transporting ATPase (P-type)